MTIQAPYISRPQTGALLMALDDAFKSPANSPTVFHVYGIGGVGKSTLARKAKEAHEKRSGRTAAVSFGVTEGIDDPIRLMKTLYGQLVEADGGWSGDPFWDLYEKYRETAERLQTQPSTGRGEVGEEQLKWVKQLLKAGTSIATGYMRLEEEARKQSQTFVEEAVDSAASLLSIRDYLQRHRVTKGNHQLQDLMLQPIPQLTQAFAGGLGQYARNTPVLLIFDTYEKVSSDLDTWLWRSLLGNTELHSSAVRVIVSGRHDLLKTEGWRKLHQDRQCMHRQTIERFDRTQTQQYLEAIGITDETRIQQIYRITRGLPYYLNWLREEREQGKEPDFSKGNEVIVNLLLQGLNDIQKRIIQYAACCRSFDRVLIQKLIEHYGLDFATAAHEERNCYGWLLERTFVEMVQGRQRLDDVARDVFRQALFQDDSELFQQTHQFLADYCKTKADAEVPPDAPYSAHYENPDWRTWRADFLYHLLAARNTASQLQFRTHLLEAGYFRQDEVIRIPLNAIKAEFELVDHPFLGYADRFFLKQIQPVVQRGWAVLEEDPVDYPHNLETYGLSKQEIDRAIQVCLQPLDLLSGLAKFAALFFQSRRCTTEQRLDWLQQANAQAETLVNPDDPEFSSGLFLWKIGNSLSALGQKEAAIASYNQALDIKPDYHHAWYNRGIALSALGQKEEAIASYDKALDIKPDKHKAWYNRGIALDDLGQKEEAIASYDKALDIEPDLHDAWNNRGIALSALGQKEEAIASYDQALDIKPDMAEAWGARGVALVSLARYEEAIESYNKSLSFNPKLHIGIYLKA
ncbi:MAG: tetratricopeptide repeat protein, partial [Cyanobacteria bacterium J06638_22]